MFEAKWIDQQTFRVLQYPSHLGYYTKLLVNRWLKADADLGKKCFKTPWISWKLLVFLKISYKN